MVRFISCVAATALASIASAAGVIHVSEIGGGISLNSGPLLPIGPGPSFLGGSVSSLHGQLNSDGITTDGFVTFAAVDTDTGLAMVALVDNPSGGAGGSPSALHMTTVSDLASIGYTTDPAVALFPSAGTRIGFGDFAWDAAGDGDAFAWSNLSLGTALTWRFQISGPLGLNQPGTFQFVNWNGTDWDLIALPTGEVSFTQTGEFVFAGTVVPAPGVAAVLALGGLAGLRRRR